MKNYITKAFIRSFSKQDKQYTIKRDAEGIYSCNCPAWIFKHEEDEQGRRICKHLRAILEHEDTIDKMVFMSDSGKYALTIDGDQWEIVTANNKEAGKLNVIKDIALNK